MLPEKLKHNHALILSKEDREKQQQTPHQSHESCQSRLHKQLATPKFKKGLTLKICCRLSIAWAGSCMTALENQQSQ
jgi:hypothetical protein